MKLEIVLSKQFKKDYKTAVKRQYNLDLIDSIISDISYKEELSKELKNHKLKGKYAGLYECHITSDLLLIYRITDNELILSRLGTHSDLFI